MNPYSAPQSAVATKRISFGQKLLGGACVFWGGLMLIAGVRQLFLVLSSLTGSSTFEDPSRAYSVGRLVGTLIGLALGYLLLRYGARKFR